uniref:Uncharacterized protein n=1 Tax=Anopheles farauti TaxID=69004 RepID=A0A182QZG6_9DIPT
MHVRTTVQIVSHTKPASGGAGSRASSSGIGDGDTHHDIYYYHPRHDCQSHSLEHTYDSEHKKAHKQQHQQHNHYATYHYTGKSGHHHPPSHHHHQYMYSSNNGSSNNSNTNHNHANGNGGGGGGAGSNHSKGRSKASSYGKRNDYERPGGSSVANGTNPATNTAAGSPVGGKSESKSRKLSCDLFDSTPSTYGETKHTKHTKSKSQSQMLLLATPLPPPPPTTTTTTTTAPTATLGSNTATLPAYMLSTVPSQSSFHRSATAVSAMVDSRESSPCSPSPPPLPPLPLSGHLAGSTNVVDQAHGIDPQDADLVLSTLRHQRDLFSGPLGIPDVTTRVGSVIHAFETMARQRQSLGGRESYHGRSDKPYDTMTTTGCGAGGSSKYRSHRSNVKRVGDANRHKIILPSPKISPSPSAETSGQFYPGQQHFQHHPTESPHHPTSQHGYPNHHHHHHHNHHHLPPASFSYTDPHGVGPGVVRRYGGGSGAYGEENIHINSNNFEPNLPHSVDDRNNHGHTLPEAMFPTVALGVSGTNTITAGRENDTVPVAGPLPHLQLTNEHESSNFDSLNLDDDYRKSSFGKQSKLLHPPQQQQQQQQQLFQRRNPPSTTNTLLLARTQQSSGSTANRTGRGLWSLFGGGGGGDAGANNPSTSSNHHTAAPGYSTSRNNPNVFFNASSTTPPTTEQRTRPTALTSSATTSIAPPLHQLSSAGASNNTLSTTMRYYNHDNNINSANRRSYISTSHNDAALADDDGPERGNEADTGVTNEGDNEAIDNHVSGDKFLRGSTVSQSFIKNVRIIGKKSSSYDVSGASGSTARKDSKKRLDAPVKTSTAPRPGASSNGDGAGTSSSSNGFKQRGSLMMAAAAKHFTKRNRAPPQPGAVAVMSEAADKPVQAEDVTNNNIEGGTANEAGKGSDAPPSI